MILQKRFTEFLRTLAAEAQSIRVQNACSARFPVVYVSQLVLSSISRVRDTPSAEPFQVIPLSIASLHTEDDRAEEYEKADDGGVQY